MIFRHAALSTIQQYTFADKLMHMKTGASIVLRVLDYVTNHPQFIKLCQNNY